MLPHARSDRRPGRLHASLRPRPRRCGGPRRRRGRARHVRVPLRLGAPRAGLRGDRALLPPQLGRERTRRPAAPCAPPSTCRGCCATAATRASADVVHYQWLPVPRLDTGLLADVHPRVFTMHWRFPEPGSRIAGTLAKLLARMDGVVAHSRHGSERLVSQFGVDPGRIEVIPHGAFDYLTRQEDEEPLPEDLAAAEGPVILAFGLIRPYKGTDVLLEAFARMRQDAELWVVGPPDGPDGAAAGPRRRRSGPRALRRPLRPRHPGPGADAPRRRRHAALPEHRAVRRALHGARLRPPAGPERDRRASPRSPSWGRPGPCPRPIPMRWPPPSTS